VNWYAFPFGALMGAWLVDTLFYDIPGYDWIRAVSNLDLWYILPGV